MKVSDAATEALNLLRHHRPADHPGPWRALVVTLKERATALRRTLLEQLKDDGSRIEVEVAHFGALRGRNDFEVFDAVYFTHLHRYAESYYVGLSMLLGAEFPRQWTSKNVTEWKPDKLIIDRAMVCDLYQDAMRIGIRRDPTRRAHIFVPTTAAPLVVRLLKLFREARFVVGSRALPPADPRAGSPA